MSSLATVPSNSWHDESQTPEAYAQAISKHAQRPQEEHLYCGENFRAFARFMTHGNSDRSQHLNRTQILREGQQPFPTVMCTCLEYGLAPGKQAYSGQSGPQNFLARPQLKPNSAHIIFVRGYPTAEWLKVLGSRLRIDPEFFRQTISFLEAKPFYDLPSPPSFSQNILQLRITTIFRRQTAITPADVQRGRRDSSKAVLRYQRLLDSAGQSIVRRYSIHNQGTYTLEQNIFCSVIRKNAGFVAVVMLDAGKDLAEGPPGPWNSSNFLPADSCLPTIQPFAKAAESIDANYTPSSVTEAVTATEFNNRTPSASLLPLKYGSFSDHNLMRTDAMYALSELFKFAICSENQFVNFMDAEVEEALQNADSEEQEKLSIANLRFSKGLLDEHISYLQETITFIRGRKEGTWPKGDMVLALETQASLLGDFESLLRRTKELASRCIDGTAIVMNSAMLQESRNAMGQAEKVKRLTILAFLFVPLTFTSSLFGMNFREFGQGQLSIWVFFGFVVPVLIFSAVVCFWGALKPRLRFNSM